jgi:hypothetical protein
MGTPSLPPPGSSYSAFLNYAQAVNPGPLPLGIEIGPVAGTNYAGNGVNDAANKAYALAMSQGQTSILGIQVSDFLDPTKYSAPMATAMEQVINNYAASIGNNLANDIDHALVTGPIDLCAQTHDFSQVAAGSNVQSQVNSDLALTSCEGSAYNNYAPPLPFLPLSSSAQAAIDIAGFGLAAAAYQGTSNCSPPPYGCWPLMVAAWAGWG